MAFYDDEDLNIWEMVHFPLPEEIREKLMTPLVVKQRLNAGDDPVELSVKKWEGIQEAVVYASERFTPHRHYKNILEFIHYKTCSLCVDSIRRYKEEHGSMKFNNDKCTVCPLAEIERCIDEDSVFNRMVKILETGYTYLETRNETIKGETLRSNHKELVALVDEMLNNIRKLK